jgi:exopolyphosphatase / guanosine-5'-triphosphate,3'-diphosphate pyrophosphatase
MSDEKNDRVLAAAERFARIHDGDPDHALAVAAICGWLFDSSTDIHGMGSGERRLLVAAGLLHDTGWSTRPDAHHKGSRDLIAGADVLALEEQERTMVACIARYHRKAHPKPSHKLYCDLDGVAKCTVNRLAALLRIADGLDRSHGAHTRGVRVVQRADTLTLVVQQDRPNPTDIWGAMRKRQLFEEEFGLAVEIVTEEAFRVD